MRRPALLLIGLVVLAGCAGLGGPGETTPGTESTPTTPTGPSSPPYETPLDAETVLSAHESAIREAGSYRFETELRVSQPGTDWRIHDRWRVASDLEANRTTIRRNASIAEDLRIFVGPSGAYQRTIVNGNPSVQPARSSAADPAQYVTPNLRPFIEGIRFTAAGSETRDGETVYVYEATERAAFDERLLDLQFYRNGTIRSVEARLVIAESGAIKSFDFRIDGTDFQGDTIVYDAPLDYRDVGSTTVEPPSWVEEARTEGDG